jgi:hypothetical protein
MEWEASLDTPAHSIDQRIKSAAWIEAFISAGGDFRIEKVSARMLEELTRDYELVVVSTGKGELGQVFPRDKSKSPFDRPQRVLALNYVTVGNQLPGASRDNQASVCRWCQASVSSSLSRASRCPAPVR